MEGYFSGLLRPPPVPGAGHPGGHPGPPPLGGVGPPAPSPSPARPGLLPSLPGYPPTGLGLGLPPSPYSGLYGADPLHAELLAREAQRAAEMRLVETQRLESLRQAEARASSFLSSFSKDPIQSLYERERSALAVQSAYGLYGLPPPAATPDLYGASPAPLGLPPPPTPPVTSPALFQRPEISPSNRQGSSPKVSLSSSIFSPHNSSSSPSPFQPPLTNNSSLAEKLKMGFSSDSSRSRPPSRQETGAQPLALDSVKKEGFLRPPSGHYATTQAPSTSTLVSTSSPSGLNFLPRSQAASSSKLSHSPWKPSSDPVDDKNDDIQIIEEEEEVLVDDFDGQCCRTYPYNHSKIQRWREERKKREEARKLKEHDRKEISRHVESVKVPTSAGSEASVGAGPKAPETITTTAGSIPVGIVSARQRTEAEKTSLAISSSSSSRPSLTQSLTEAHRSSNDPHRPGLPPDMGAMPLPPSGPLVGGLPTSTHGMGPSTWSSGPPPPWPPVPGAAPYSSPWGAPAAPPPGCGPIPMGYQLAKDPITGQILLIPTDPAARPGHPPAAPGLGHPQGPGLGPPPGLWPGYDPPTSSAASLHHLHLLQQQQHLQYMQHSQDMLQQSLRHNNKSSQPPRVPETITVSDDDDEESTPQTVTVKSEAPQVKTEVKLEVGDTEVCDLSKVKTDFSETTSDLRLNIKQERQERSASITHEEASQPQQPEPQSLKKEIVFEPEPTLSEESKLCAETLLLFSELPSDSVISNEDTTEQTVEDCSGFELLFQGLEMLTGSSHVKDNIAALDVLCNVTRNDTFEYGLSGDLLTDDRLDLGLLCQITNTDYQDQLAWVDPLLKLKAQYNVLDYDNADMEKEAKSFISQKIKQFTKDHPETVEEEKYDNIKSLAKMVKKIKNMEIMSQLEVDLRLKITELQNKYRDSQKSLSKLKTPKKKIMKNKKGKQRGPGRPKKKKFPNPKSKMGRPRKHPKVEPKVEVKPEPVPSPPLELALETKVKLEEEDVLDSDAPPVLEPQQELRRPQTAAAQEYDADYESSYRVAGLLKPPRLTASSPPPPMTSSEMETTSDGRSTTLSTLTSKFMKGKANPFANLLSKLNSGPSGPGDNVGSDTRAEDTEPEQSELGPDPDHSSSDKDSDESSSDAGSTIMSPTRDTSFKFGKTSKLSYGLEAYRHMKKRKADKPKKHSGGSSETIVPKKPKNLFMMMDFQRGFSSKTAEDEYNFDEHEEEEFGQKPSFDFVKDPRPEKSSPTPSAKSQESHYQEWTDDDSHQSPAKKKHKKSKLFKSCKKERSPSQSSRVEEPVVEQLRSAQLKASDLKDGLRMLILQEGKFWPARLNSTKLPDVYGVVIDRQRGNRPIILPRDDILKEAVLEIKPKSVYQLPIGSRVCTVWSSAISCLFPGTIVTPDEPLPANHVLVELDDGDSRLVEVNMIRMLPSDYSRVVYDPDPIASLRKRRVSTDSHDSGASHHGDLRQGHESKKPSSKLAESSFPTEKKKVRMSSGGSESKVKKKHKKCHKHHHCHKSHKHKRHRSGSAEMTSHKSGGAKRQYDESDHETLEQAGDHDSSDDSEQHNSSDEEDASHGRASHPDLTSNKGRELWSWAGEGYKRPGGKGKSKKLFFKSIQRGKDTLHVNDCAVFLSTGRSDRPYIGKIEMLWETSAGSMMCKVKWFYHPEEIETCGRKFDLKLPGGLFQSPHTDENSVHTISHKCEVLPIKEYTRYIQSDSKKKGTSYYLAGSYDPAGLSVHFQPGVLKSSGAEDSD